MGSWKPLKTIGFIDVFELGRHKEASRDPWGHLGDEQKNEKNLHFKGSSGKGPPKGRPKGTKGKPKAFLGIPGGGRGAPDDGITAASVNTAAVRRFRFGFIQNTFEKQAIHTVKVKIPKKRSKPTTKYDENSKTAATVCENQGFQRTQYHLDLQLFKVCSAVDPSRGPIKRPTTGPSRRHGTAKHSMAK